MRSQAFIILITLLGGSFLSQAGGLDEIQMKERPRIRVASSPYPNVLFRSLKEPEFGQHQYLLKLKLRRAEREVSRGHFYTRRGGFIDLAHLRKTVDWAAWLQAQIAKDLSRGKTTLSYTCSEPSLYQIKIQYPESVALMDADERAQFQHALSIELALYTSYTALTWHEILTWYGYSAVPGISEQESAFSYEDMYTHAVGIAIARTALRDETRTYDAAITAALTAELRRLEPMGREDTTKALAEVKGSWWRFGKSLKRYTDIGLKGPLQPWLVDAFPCEEPVHYAVPDLLDVLGFDMREQVDFHIEPKVPQGERILDTLEYATACVEPATDFEVIMQDIQAAMQQRFGAQVSQPSTKP